MNQFKILIGKTVWLRPTGNNLRMNRADRTAVIENVGRTKVELRINGRLSSYSVHPNNPMELCTNNAGYVLYESEQELINYYRAVSLAKMIKDQFPYQQDWERLPLEKIEAVASILGLCTEDILGGEKSI